MRRRWRSKAQEIADHQAQLVALQAAVDATFAQMEEFRSTIAELLDRQAAMAAERAKEACPGPPQAVSESEGLRYAQKRLADIVAGARNFDIELPQVQALLQQVAMAFDAARADPSRDQGQQTIQSAFARQSGQAQQFHIASGIATPSSGAATPAASVVPSGAATMEVVGECPGDTRKLEHLSPSPLGSNAGDAITELEPSLCDKSLVHSQPTDASAQVSAAG